MKNRNPMIFIMLFMAGITGIGANETWMTDAEFANKYYWNKDYNAAWAFYERAIALGCNDGLIIYRAALSFRFQKVVDDSDYQSDLYAVAHYYLSKQYPDSKAIAWSEKYIKPDTIINRRLLKRVYTRAGGKLPSPINISEIMQQPKNLFYKGKEYIGQSLDNYRYVFMLVRKQGLREAVVWIKPRILQFLLSWVAISILSGIILPLVMAIAVSKEGRKSYVTSYALLIHWGLLGLHRFYLERWKTGLIWLFTGGLLGIGIFFDIFLTGAYTRFWNEDNKGNIRTSRSPKPRKPPKSARLSKQSLPPEPETTPLMDDFEPPSFNQPSFDLDF